MNREEFLKYLESPGQLDKRSILEVHELLNEFPYFQTAHLMLLKNLHVLGNIKFDSQLKKSAAYIGNRSVLYYLLHKPEKKEPKKEPEQVDKQEKEALADVVLKRIEEIKKEKKVAQEKKTSAGILPIADKILNEFAEKKKPGKGAESQAKDSKVNQILEIENENEILEDIYGEKEQLDADELKIIAGDDELLDLEEENIEENLQDTADEKVKNDELINKFIINSPHILSQKPDVRDKEQTDISESSGRENEGFITETLAKIYINQGYYSKAIFAYEKLSLKFPEKSSYFATQVEKIKKLINEL